MKKKVRARTDIVNVRLRMREELRAKLDAAADDNDTSLNSEIVRRLEGSLTRDELLPLTNFLLDRLSKYEKPADVISEFVGRV